MNSRCAFLTHVLGLHERTHFILSRMPQFINGRSAKFATTKISNALFVGQTVGEINTPESPRCAVEGICQGPMPVGTTTNGFFYPSEIDAGNGTSKPRHCAPATVDVIIRIFSFPVGWTHAINLPGIGSQVKVYNSVYHNYQAAFYGCSWCVSHRGGYEMEFHNTTMHNVAVSCL